MIEYVICSCSNLTRSVTRCFHWSNIKIDQSGVLISGLLGQFDLRFFVISTHSSIFLYFYLFYERKHCNVFHVNGGKKYIYHVKITHYGHFFKTKISQNFFLLPPDSYYLPGIF